MGEEGLFGFMRTAMINTVLPFYHGSFPFRRKRTLIPLLSWPLLQMLFLIVQYGN